MKESKVNALITLLDDPDEAIYDQVKDELLSIGEDAIPYLESAWEASFPVGPFSNILVLQNRIENLIHKIQFNTNLNHLKNWAKYDSTNLLNGAVIIAKYQYPDLDRDKIVNHISMIRNDIWLELDDSLTAYEKIRLVNQIIYEIHGFSGNTNNFHAPQNSFINDVLESKRGNPLSLSIIYLAICQALGFPLKGINLPKHFILGYMKSSDEIDFYINPFSRGAVFSHRDINDFLVQLKIEPKKSYYAPCTNYDMILRILINLKYSYEKLGYKEKIEELEEMIYHLDQGQHEKK